MAREHRFTHKDKTADAALGAVSADRFHAIDMQTKALLREEVDRRRNERLRKLREAAETPDGAA